MRELGAIIEPTPAETEELLTLRFKEHIEFRIGKEHKDSETSRGGEPDRQCRHEIKSGQQAGISVRLFIK